MYVDPGEIGDEALVAKRLDIEDKQTLRLLRSASVPFGAQKDAKFKGHIESRKIAHRIELRAGDIMNAETALTDQVVQLLDSGLPGIVQLSCGARAELAGVDREYQRAKNRFIGVIKGTVDENVVGRITNLRGQSLLFLSVAKMSGGGRSLANRYRSRF